MEKRHHIRLKVDLENLKNDFSLSKCFQLSNFYNTWAKIKSSLLKWFRSGSLFRGCSRWRGLV